MALINASIETSIEQLNSFLRGEISAVETYRQALDRLKTFRARGVLEDCQRSHQTRVELLKRRITTLGGQPAEGSGAWGIFAKAVEGGAAVLGEKAAIAALEEGEDHGMKDFQADMGKLDPAVRTLVEDELLPEQRRTHDSVSSLKKTLN